MDETWLKGDLELLKRCDAVWALPGWDTSIGATGEVNHAKSLNIPVFTAENEVYEFLNSSRRI
jgi:hypothetical protein